MTPDQLTEIEKLLAQATPGPWRHMAGVKWSWIDAPGVGRWVADTHVPDNSKRYPAQEEANAALIVALVNAAPALLSAAREGEKMRVALERIDGVARRLKSRDIAANAAAMLLLDAIAYADGDRAAEALAAKE